MQEAGKVPGGTVVVARAPDGHRDRWRAYRILVDGARVGTVRRGRQREIPEAAGQHTVELRIDWCSSPVVSVDVRDGTCVALRCGPPSAFAGGSALNSLTSDRGQYIWLEVDGAQG